MDLTHSQNQRRGISQKSIRLTPSETELLRLRIKRAAEIMRNAMKKTNEGNYKNLIAIDFEI